MQETMNTADLLRLRQAWHAADSELSAACVRQFGAKAHTGRYLTPQYNAATHAAAIRMHEAGLAYYEASGDASGAAWQRKAIEFHRAATPPHQTPGA